MRRSFGILLAALIAGCNAAQTPQIPQAAGNPAVVKRAAAPWDALYVLNTSWVDVYEPGSIVPARTLRMPHNVEVDGIAFDASGEAYVSSFGGGHGQPHDWPSAVYVFHAGAIHPYRTISDGITWPSALAFDSHGYLYVANTGKAKHTWRLVDAGVTVYAPGGDKPVRTITWKDGACEIETMLMSPGDDLYVANGRDCGGTGRGNIEVYAPNATTPYRTIRTGIYEPAQMALDATGTLYVAAYRGAPVYPPKATAPSKVYLPKYGASSIAVDREGTVYVLDDWLFVYRKGGLKASAIVQGSWNDLALDPYENVYVTSEGSRCGPYGSSGSVPCVIEYGHRALRTLRVIPNPNSQANGLAFGPR